MSEDDALVGGVIEGDRCVQTLLAVLEMVKATVVGEGWDMVKATVVVRDDS